MSVRSSSHCSPFFGVGTVFVIVAVGMMAAAATPTAVAAYETSTQQSSFSHTMIPSQLMSTTTRQRRRRQRPASTILLRRDSDPDTRLTTALRSARLDDSSVADADATTLSSSSNNNINSWWDKDTLLQYATTQGVELSLSTLGPAYRGVARSTHNRTLILGYVEGFVRPTGKLLHMDKMEVFRPNVKEARMHNPDFTGGGSPLGVGLLIAHLCVLHGLECGCTVAEFLAIDDSDKQHQRLVRLYKQAGFNVVKYVGDDWRDVPDRLVWGGCGTLLRQDVTRLLDFWTTLMEKSRSRAKR